MMTMIMNVPLKAVFDMHDDVDGADGCSPYFSFRHSIDCDARAYDH